MAAILSRGRWVKDPAILVALKFDQYLGSITAEMLVEFQNKNLQT